ncbi:MAG: hypothetical protein ACO3JL_18445, partial [Myxococcota bacterium]
RGGALLGALLDDQTELPPGVVIAESGRQVRSPTQEEIGESAPSSGRRRLITSWSPPLEATEAEVALAYSAPSSSAPSSSSSSSFGARR